MFRLILTGILTVAIGSPAWAQAIGVRADSTRHATLAEALAGELRC